MKPPVAILAVLVALGACGGGEHGVSVALDEFSIDASPARTQAGHVQFSVTNRGDIPHTLLVLRTSLEPDDLPVKDSAVDVEAPGIDVAVQTRDPLEATAAVVLAMAAHLEPGPYVLICNVPGHYQSGMHAALTVTAP